jgi:hypothetical protein
MVRLEKLPEGGQQIILGRQVRLDKKQKDGCSSVQNHTK